MKNYTLVPENSAILRRIASITPYGKDVVDLINDMKVVMAREGGIGLAAPQIGVDARVIIVCTPEGVSRGWCNPQILSSEGAVDFLEGCLSLPGKRVLKKRGEHLTIKAQNENGITEIFEVTGLEAICFQHEIDHLNGILIGD